MIKLLESVTSDENDVLQQVYDGAVINYQACSQRNGFIYGCSLVSENKRISISTGLLIIRGYRLRIDDTTVILDLSSAALPSTSTTYYLFIQIERSGNNARWSVKWQSSLSARNTTAIEQVDGIYDYPIASFVASSTLGISSVSSLMSKITSTGSVNSSTSLSERIPTPQLAIVHDSAKSNPYYGYLVLANRNDYMQLGAKYTVSLVLYRHLSKARSCKSMGLRRIRYNKSGFVKVLHTSGSNLGWEQSSKEPFRLSILVNENDDSIGMKKAIVREEDQMVYTRNDIIESMSTYAKGMFYDPGQSFDAGLNCMIPRRARSMVTAYSNPYFIRCTRSKKGWNGITSAENWAGPYGKWHKYNEFKFAYAIEIKDASNKIIAESPLSAIISIRPNYSFNVEFGDYTNRTYVNDESQLFRFKIG